VTSISYGAGHQACRQVGFTWEYSSVQLPRRIIQQNVQHYVSIEYESADPQKGGVLIQAHKDNYRNVLALLRGATGKEIEN